MVEEINIKEESSSNKKYKILLIIIIILIILVIIVILFLFMKSASGLDLTITNVTLSKPANSNFTNPVLTIKNIGTLDSNSTFLIAVYLNDVLVINWMEPRTITAGQSIQSGGVSLTLSPTITKITFIIDALNQTQDVNRKNNIYVYKLE